MNIKHFGLSTFIAFAFFFTGFSIKSYAQDEIFNPTEVDVQPEYIGGVTAMSAYISKTTKYPKGALQRKISGKVFIQFVVGADGAISYVKSIKELDPDLEDEGVRVVRTFPKWTPGMKGGKAVAVRQTIPISFKPPTTPQTKEDIQASNLIEDWNLEAPDEKKWAVSNNVSTLKQNIVEFIPPGQVAKSADKMLAVIIDHKSTETETSDLFKRYENSRKNLCNRVKAIKLLERKDTTYPFIAFKLECDECRSLYGSFSEAKSYVYFLMRGHKRLFQAVLTVNATTVPKKLEDEFLAFATKGTVTYRKPSYAEELNVKRIDSLANREERFDVDGIAKNKEWKVIDEPDNGFLTGYQYALKNENDTNYNTRVTMLKMGNQESLPLYLIGEFVSRTMRRECTGAKEKLLENVSGAKAHYALTLSSNTCDDRTDKRPANNLIWVSRGEKYIYLTIVTMRTTTEAEKAKWLELLKKGKVIRG